MKRLSAGSIFLRLENYQICQSTGQQNRGNKYYYNNYQDVPSVVCPVFAISSVLKLLSFYFITDDMTLFLLTVSGGI